MFTAKLLAPGYDEVNPQHESRVSKLPPIPRAWLYQQFSGLKPFFPAEPPTPTLHNLLILAPLQVLSLFYSNVQ